MRQKRAKLTHASLRYRVYSIRGPRSHRPIFVEVKQYDAFTYENALQKAKFEAKEIIRQLETTQRRI